MEGPRPIQGLSGLGRAGQPILAGVPFGEGFQPAQSRRKAAAGRIARQDCLHHRLLWIGVHRGLGECVDRFRSAPAEEIIERVAIRPFTVGRRKRVENEGFDPRKRRGSWG